jgi:hypothetical protein
MGCEWGVGVGVGAGADAGVKAGVEAGVHAVAARGVAARREPWGRAGTQWRGGAPAPSPA